MESPDAKKSDRGLKVSRGIGTFLKKAYFKSNFGEAWRLRFWRIGDGERVEDPVWVEFLIIFGKEKTNGQGEKMNSEEKKQNPIFGVPPQKQKNHGTHYQ